MFATRFAPSPTGYLHRGHAFSALTAHAAAREADGRFLLRIEDIDATRCRPEFEDAIFEDLAWLGLDWETPVRRQSQHLADYEAALESLRAEGLVYRCFRTRRERAEAITRAPHQAPDAWRGVPLAPEAEAERVAAGDAFAWRLHMAAVERVGLGLDTAGVGDEVLARKDVGVAYHLAVVVDDALQGITHVIRGEDLAAAVPVQRVLQALLGLPTPTYRHHRLLTGPDGKRYAKRDKAETLRDLRARGVAAGELRLELGFE